MLEALIKRDEKNEERLSTTLTEVRDRLKVNRQSLVDLGFEPGPEPATIPSSGRVPLEEVPARGEDPEEVEVEEDREDEGYTFVLDPEELKHARGAIGRAIARGRPINFTPPVRHENMWDRIAGRGKRHDLNEWVDFLPLKGKIH